MKSAPNSYTFPYVPSPTPPPGHPTTPPPPPAPQVVPPPPPQVFPPPPPHVFPPPPPHVTPVPPHVPPPPLPPLPPQPHHHPIIIVIVIVSCGGLLFLACLCATLFCFLKKRKKKTVEKTHDEIVKIDEHLKIKEAIEEGPHGKKTVLLSVEDDVHIERVDIDEMKLKESLGQEKMQEEPPEITPSDLEEGRSSSSPKNHHLKQDS